MREDAQRSHIATRNFFAWLCRKPLVGHYLGDALADLYHRMGIWRSASVDNVEEILIYADLMGYSNVEHRPDNALAMLAFAERARIPHVWIDSFAHCTGMNSQIGGSCEFGAVSRPTKALITRAYLEMDLHLDRTSRRLVNFLDEELSASYLGLSEGARKHLDNFRSFLHSHCVGKYGYWPPFNPTNYPRDLYHDLYHDFNSLYHFLADKSSNSQTHLDKPATGGICVKQNLQSFDSRHKFNPLPYSSPLLPTSTHDGKTRSQKSIRSLKRMRDSSASRSNQVDRNRSLLHAATNRDDGDSLQSRLVQQYIEWEERYAAHADEKVSILEARKVRWILIYGMLQTVFSAIQAPPEVRDAANARYPLCILTTGLPAWHTNTNASSSRLSSVTEQPSAESLKPELPNNERASTPALSIHPDFEEETYSGFWANNNGSFESQSSTSDTKRRSALKRASTKLQKNTIKRRSLTSQTESKTASQTELVSGRTLAELAYGQSSKPPEQGSEKPHGFDFGFGDKQDGVDPRPSVDEDEVSRMSSIVTSKSQSTFDDFHDSLEFHQNTASRSDPSDTASIPSLTYSHGSRDTMGSFYSGHSKQGARNTLGTITPDSSLSRANSGNSEKEIRGAALVDPFVQDVEDSPGPYHELTSAHLVTRFTDFMEKDLDAFTNSSTESLCAGDFDRAAVIQHDGVLDENLLSKYRSMGVS